MRGDVVAALLMAVGAAGIAATRARLAEEHQHVRETSDVYVLPPPDEVVALSLGYRAALADVLWADVMVSQGLHMQEHRRYETVSRLIDAINALDPTFRSPYMLADALITFQTAATSVEEVEHARAIMERGTRALPLDGPLWLALGGFVGYVAPGSYLTDEDQIRQWRIDGANYLIRAAELSGDDTNIAWQALGGANLLARAGQREAQLSFFQRACSISDDPEFKQECDKKLGALMGEEQLARYEARQRAFGELWKHDIKYVNLSRVLVVGPPTDTAYCAGDVHPNDARCATNWREWAVRTDAAGQGK